MLLTQDNYSLLTCASFVSLDGKIAQDDSFVKTRIPILFKFYTAFISIGVNSCNSAFFLIIQLLSQCIFASDSSDRIFLIFNINNTVAVAAESVSEIGSAQ